MKRIASFIAILAVLLLACNISKTATPAPTVPPVLTPPPLVTESPLVQANVTCNDLSLYLDPALASGHTCQAVPEAGDASLPPFGMNPQYTELTLQGYILPERFFEPHIDIFPVQRYSQLLPDLVTPRVTDLQSLIDGGPVTGDTTLPLLPIFNAGQEFYAQYRVISFANGSGIRFLTQYSQALMPINNYEISYVFQGLTDDGQYWVSVILPVSSPILPERGDSPPDGQTWEEFGNDFASYIADITGQLDSQPPDSFTPTIAMLDALVASITIQQP